MASITTRNGRRCTAVPKIANIQLESSTSSSSSSSTSISSSSSSTSTSISSSSISTATSTSLSSSSTSISISADPSATAIENPTQPDSATQLSSETLQSTTSTTAIINSPPTIAAPAIGQTTSSELPSSLISTTNVASLTSSGAALLTAAESPSSSDTLVSDSSTSTELAATQPADSLTSTALGGNTAALTAGTTQSTGSSSLETETNGGMTGTKQVTGSAITTQQTIAIAVGVAGGVMVITLIAFLIWIWRKRKMQGRRSTLLTPLSPDATFRGDEKGPYTISRTSVGPTPIPEKVWTVVGTKYKKFRGRVNDIVARSSSPSPSVNLDRGTSQFGPPDAAHSRNNSNAGLTGGPPAKKGQFVDWWGRLAEDGESNWRLRDESKTDPMNNASFAAARSTHNGIGPNVQSQPDFLTLINMDDNQPEREAARGRSSVSRGQRRSISVGNEQHFLGGLGLDFEDPFSDVNAIGNNTAKAKPMVVSAANNPFSDANAIKPPSAAANGGLTTYVQNVRRSRGHSVNGGGISRQTSNAGTIYRESNVSVDTIGARRNKFRSDPFDLDRPDLLSANSSIDATIRNVRGSRGSRGVGLPNTPKSAHVRTESFTSKYSSGTSMGQWSDPGPDVGPATRYTPTPDNGVARRDSDTRRSGSSQGSVGKAL
ncbi:hypothetical protein F4804DRAFT_135415 [Jackrogersella minutella]|nr:hypothetical protein F4804DRAFT_135415 [Jackrogersella minutella]